MSCSAAGPRADLAKGDHLVVQLVQAGSVEAGQAGVQVLVHLRLRSKLVHLHQLCLSALPQEQRLS